MEERLRRESEAHAAAQRELDQMKKVSSEDSRKVKRRGGRGGEGGEGGEGRGKAVGGMVRRRV